MNENQNPDDDQKTPPLKWPKFALAAVILFLLLAIFWMSVAVNKLHRERQIDAPLPVATPTR